MITLNALRLAAFAMSHDQLRVSVTSTGSLTKVVAGWIRSDDGSVTDIEVEETVPAIVREVKYALGY